MQRMRALQSFVPYQYSCVVENLSGSSIIVVKAVCLAAGWHTVYVSYSLGWHCEWMEPIQSEGVLLQVLRLVGNEQVAPADVEDSLREGLEYYLGDALSPHSEELLCNFSVSQNVKTPSCIVCT